MNNMETVKEILQQAQISDDAKKLWITTIEAGGKPAAEEFIKSVGDDANAMRLATEFLEARFSGEEVPEKGMVTIAEQKLIQNFIKMEEDLASTE